MTRAWKFLDDRSRDTLAGVAWPTPNAAREPGQWVSSADVNPRAQGVQACTADQLAWWFSAQMWEVELAGHIAVAGHTTVADRGRLVRLVDGWPDVGIPLAEWAVWRVRDNTVAILAQLGYTAAGDDLASASTFESVARAGSAAQGTLGSAAGVAVAQILDALDDIATPIFACWDAARSAGHRASADNLSVDAYTSAFAAERLAQSVWVAERLELSRDS